MKLRKAVMLVCALSLLAVLSMTEMACNTNNSGNTDNQQENTNVKEENDDDTLKDVEPKGNSENNPLNESTNSNDADGKGIITPGRVN